MKSAFKAENPFPRVKSEAEQMSKLVLVLLWICLVVVGGCTNEAPELPSDNQEPVNCIPEFPEMDVTYENYAKDILTRYCIECHYPGNSPGPGDFTTYNGVRAYAENAFYFRVIQDRADMPQNNAPLPKSIRDSLNIWISNCIPEN